MKDFCEGVLTPSVSMVKMFNYLYCTMSVCIFTRLLFIQCILHSTFCGNVERVTFKLPECLYLSVHTDNALHYGGQDQFLVLLIVILQNGNVQQVFLFCFVFGKVAIQDCELKVNGY